MQADADVEGAGDLARRSERQGEDDDFGRKFTIQSFRWLGPGEV